jgi:probable H4MPT-linked C1 transfer pathway protein
MSVLGFDIGGANIKAAMADGRTRSVPFPLWKQPERLAAALSELVAEYADCESVAVTMTGELADCFVTRAEGVQRIAAAVHDAVGRRPVRFWTTAGRFVGPDQVADDPLEIAAANWHALATWVGRQLPPDPALLIDIGTTTTDLIPLADGRPVAIGLTDRGRLTARELVYTGVRRTPLCAVSDHVRWDDATVPVAAELFATMHDVFLLLGDVPEDPADGDTANGRPATIAAAHDRIARMVCSDRDDVSLDRARQFAQQFADGQQATILEAVRTVIDRQPSPPATVVVSGSGEFLARRVVAALPELQSGRTVSLSTALAPELAAAACAYAVAQLAVRL